ncbi:hypothetical protein Skr01_30280 [Sphaerisporangium krabiense]|uniref:Putative oxidoreductase n=1 Tax=Sphaerisporangium krabiense TaxID=763782 RepID=A0A7W8Z1K5_9ACTN|nr:DoxX family protein [Sphaerisporangium krabiense]MBB5625721.1 putative oxidoreductase [Sphaerisporangium krabiense]GII62943.1 hypothetical protein Skr01_30280 [Sphaerisporangium krabiense]
MNLNRRYPYLSHLGLLLLRLALGVIFVAHGWQKLSTMGHSATVAMFEQMNAPLPTVSAVYATWVELLGGLALIVGLGLPIAGLLLFLDMAGAFLFVHVGHGVFVTDGGFELVLALGAGSLALALLGGGRYGVDGLLSARRSGRTEVTA